MEMEQLNIAGDKINYYFDSSFHDLGKITDKNSTVLITDTNIFRLYASTFEDWKVIVIQAGEAHKNLQTVQLIIEQLIDLEAERGTTLVGVGGGVVTDITGFVAATYMRGLPFGFVPTTILNMVDASIGGKNGIDFGLYKNMVGTILQPQFILQDVALLHTLPQAEWENGFAEIIKHACIKDATLFDELQQNDILYYQTNKAALLALLKSNVRIKWQIVEKDVQEKGDRKLLNFGHTIGHAIETNYQLSHGHAIAIGMVMAAKLSAAINVFNNTENLIALLHKYGLPTQIKFNTKEVFQILKMDKKRLKSDINFILLEKIGKAYIQRIPLIELEQYLHSFEQQQ